MEMGSWFDRGDGSLTDPGIRLANLSPLCNDSIWHDVSHVAGIARFAGSHRAGNSLAGQKAICAN